MATGADRIALALGITTDPKRLVRAIFSGRRRNMNPEFEKIHLRPVQIGPEVKLQLVTTSKDKIRTTNIDFADFDPEKLWHSGYANLLVDSTTESITARFTKKGEALVSVKRAENVQDLAHDKTRNYLIRPESEFAFRLGLTDKTGRIKPSMNKKFIQIEEFVRILLPLVKTLLEKQDLDEPSSSRPLTIVDHGCGNAYLTFAVHLFLLEQNISNKVIGIDRREDSRQRNRDAAQSLGLGASVDFIADEISNFNDIPTDIVLALHACDTATDDALAWAVHNSAKIVLVAPCCHQDLQRQMSNDVGPWSLVVTNPILKQRLGDILTDSFRAQLMRIFGYRTDVFEFVGDVHTPRNA
ncbi:MAG: class I SAM-dependent methyltransferase, partial [Actinomycetota bacterium]